MYNMLQTKCSIGYIIYCKKKSPKIPHIWVNYLAGQFGKPERMININSHYIGRQL